MSDYQNLTRREKNTIDRILGMREGYVLDFSNKTIEEYFEDEFELEFYHDKFSINGGSKAKTLRAIFELVDTRLCVKILRSLWEYRTTLPTYYKEDTAEKEQIVTDAFFQLVIKLEGDNPVIMTDALEVFEKSDTLQELIGGIERDIQANSPQAALDRLHTYCQKKFRFLIETKGGIPIKDEPLHSRVGKYCRLLEAENTTTEMSTTIIKNSISIFEKFNSIRNNKSFAHDNSILDLKEARFIFDSVSAVLRFIKSIDQAEYGS